MKDLGAERSIRKQPRVTYEMTLRIKTAAGEGILTGKAPALHRELPSSSPGNAQLTLTSAAVSPCVHFSTKLAQSWFLGVFSFQRSMEKLEEELSLNPHAHKAQHTHVHSCLLFFGCGNLQGTSVVWGCCDGSEDSCSHWADPMTERKKRRQTQVFNKTFINDFPGRTLALAQRENSSLGTVLNWRIFSWAPNTVKSSQVKHSAFPPPEELIEQQGFGISQPFYVLEFFSGIIPTQNPLGWTLGPFLQHQLRGAAKQCIAQAGAHRVTLP